MTQPRCEIVFLQHSNPIRWRWRCIDANGAVRASNEDFGLFYECVTAARDKGYEPHFAGKRIVCAAPPGLPQLKLAAGRRLR